MAVKPIVTLALLMGCAAVTRGETECSDAGECGAEENSLLALHSAQNSSRRRKSPVQCRNDDGTRFECAAGDKCCGGACVAEHDVCCENVNGDNFPCQGEGGGCCGNACYAPGSKCCKPAGPKSGWYPVSKDTECRKASVQCTNRNGDEFECAAGDQCCGDTCVSKDDVCCENVLGNSFPCQGNGGGCCGNTCAAPGSKCCKPEGPKSAWYPVSKETECRKAPVQCTNDDGTRFECAAGDKCCGGACVGEHDVCCENVNGDNFPCQGEGGGCCGNACYAPGSKCCKPAGPKSAWYPVSKDTECRKASVQCTNRNGDEFECATGDQCCGDTCVSKDDVCCENVLGNSFPCQGNGGGCCGNACYAPGSKCCKSPWVAKARWYPVTKATKCAW